MSESTNSLNDDEKTDAHRLRHLRCMNNCHLNCFFKEKLFCRRLCYKHAMFFLKMDQKLLKNITSVKEHRIKENEKHMTCVYNVSGFQHYP